MSRSYVIGLLLPIVLYPACVSPVSAAADDAVVAASTKPFFETLTVNTHFFQEKTIRLRSAD